MADERIQRTTLANGLEVVTEHMAGVRSASLGVWVGVGNRDEEASMAGASHCLEHLLFKGTDRWSARALAEAVDRTGGEVNAFTSKEYTAYHARVPDSEVTFALDLLCGVVKAPAFTAADLEAERLVILEELAASEDYPDDVAHTALQAALFPEHPLGWEVLGTAESIRGLQADTVHAFHQHWYQPVNLVFAAAGNVEHEQIVAGVTGAFGSSAPGVSPARRPPTLPTEQAVLIERPTEQTHVALGWPSLGHGDDDRFALAIANQVIGGGLSSRLFQEVREKRGLAYSVFSNQTGYRESGSFTVYAATAAERANELLAVLDHEIDDLIERGVTGDELALARAGFEGATLLGLEDSSSRMARLGTALTLRGYVPTIESFLDSLRAVTVDDVHRVITRVFSGPRVMSAVGDVAPLAGA
ncbi:MAG: insulinase family protein [Acidimicrobiales bacterium]|nr:insulinase family protein [Acidimicrobiales bacterium]